MINHLINNCAWLLYHKIIPLCTVYDNITCQRSGFHSCVWALHPNLYTTFTGVTVFTIFAVSVKIAALLGALLTSSLTAFHWLDEFSNISQIYNMRNFCSFRKNRSSRRGPLLQVFTDLTNFSRFYNIRSCLQTWTYLSLLVFWGQ